MLKEKHARLYVRVFKVNSLAREKVLNKTFVLREYSEYLRMMDELRGVFWREYVASRGVVRLKLNRL